MLIYCCNEAMSIHFILNFNNVTEYRLNENPSEIVFTTTDGEKHSAGFPNNEIGFRRAKDYMVYITNSFIEDVSWIKIDANKPVEQVKNEAWNSKEEFGFKYEFNSDNDKLDEWKEV